jgi:SAM-dependent methyltransferase
MTNQFCHCEERSDEAISKQRSQNRDSSVWSRPLAGDHRTFDGVEREDRFRRAAGHETRDRNQVEGTMKEKEKQRWIQTQKKFLEWREQQKQKTIGQPTVPNTSYDPVARMIAQYIQSGKILDIGCHAGGLRKSKFIPTDLTYYGLDPFRIEGVEYDFPYEQIMVENCVDVYGVHVFDAAAIKDSTDHVVNLNDTLAAIHMVLRPGGFLFISEAGRAPRSVGLLRKARRVLGGLKRKLSRMRRTSQTIEVIDFYPNGYITTETIFAALRRQGFRVISESQVEGARLNIVSVTC